MLIAKKYYKEQAIHNVNSVIVFFKIMANYLKVILDIVNAYLM